MTQRNDLERVLDLWLAEGPTHVPDRVFDDAVARVYRQSQPSAWRSRWRNFEMTTPMRLAGAIAVIAVIGVGLVLLGPGNIGPPGPAATPSPSVLPTPTSVVSGASRLPGSGTPVEPGRYYVEGDGLSPATFSFTIPAGWLSGGTGVGQHPDDSGREISWGVTTVDGPFAQPCGPNERLTIGPTAEDLIDALRVLPGLDVSPGSIIDIDGRNGLMVELAVASGLDDGTCDPPIGLQVWNDRGGNYLVVGPEVVTRVYAVDVDGERFVLVSHHGISADPAEIAETTAMIESIRFEP